MTHVRDLLHASAAEPAQPLDWERVVARSRSRWSARIFAALGGLSVLVGGGVAVDSLLAPASRGHDVATVPSPVGREVDASAVNANATPRVADSATAGNGVVVVPTPAPIPPPLGRPTTTTSTTIMSTGREGCVARGHETGVGDANGGVGVGPVPQCSYTASQRGGYRAEGNWHIDIDRPGVGRFTLTSKQNGPCGAVGVIEPGDTVTAVLQSGLNSPDSWYVAVGPGEHC